jgi:hypothetical protein
MGDARVKRPRLCGRQHEKEARRKLIFVLFNFAGGSGSGESEAADCVAVSMRRRPGVSYFFLDLQAVMGAARVKGPPVWPST